MPEMEPPDRMKGLDRPARSSKRLQPQAELSLSGSGADATVPRGSAPPERSGAVTVCVFPN
jgi:hypothetical protein